jgi:hypothetical protein
MIFWVQNLRRRQQALNLIRISIIVNQRIMWVGASASWELCRLGGSWIEESLYKAIPQQLADETPNAAYFLSWERRRLGGSWNEKAE